MRKWIIASGLIAAIVVSFTWTGIRIYRQRPARPVPGSFHRSKVDAAGHTRGIVQVDLMRRILADRARSAARDSGPADAAGHRVPSQAHPLLGHAAPPVVLADSGGKTRDLLGQLAEGPVVVVFYLGA